ncbi:MAG TPA: DUF2065 domain-containing protein [Alphaproteobacteria bacterium]|nr:DUF2065 domain-containing protein [Alphaproteobacteria bacterium]
MASLGFYLLTAIALIFVIEGLLYAIFPKQIQRVMAMASTLPPEKFRSFGAAMLSFGVLLVWILSKV